MKIAQIILITIVVCVIAIFISIPQNNKTGYMQGYKDGENKGFDIAMDTILKIARNQIKSDTTVYSIIITTDKDTVVFNLSAKTCLKHAEPTNNK
jgi:hypothetical protein